MLPFDRVVLEFLNGFAHRSVPFDVLAVIMTRSRIFGGGFVMAAFWWAWFRRGSDDTRYRSTLLATLLGAFVAIVAGRLLALTLPYHVRPLHDPTLHLVIPYGLNVNDLRGWSSFPSDHAMMFFELAVGVLVVYPQLGWLLLAHALFVICLPRVYTGLHFPTDIIGGAVIGAITALGMTSPRVRDAIARPLLAIETQSPSAFYTAMFMLSVEVADMFGEPRALLTLILSGRPHPM